MCGLHRESLLVYTGCPNCSNMLPAVPPPISDVGPLRVELHTLKFGGLSSRGGHWCGPITAGGRLWASLTS